MPAKGQKRPFIDRLMEKVRVLDNGCWEFTGFINKTGYGTCYSGNMKDSHLAHVNSFLAHGGVIPDGFEVDHTCHKTEHCDGGISCPHRRCVNPDHLEAVTKLENRRRSHHRIDKCQAAGRAAKRAISHCPQGHEYNERNTRYWRGERSCAECGRISARERARRKFGWKPRQSVAA